MSPHDSNDDIEVAREDTSVGRLIDKLLYSRLLQRITPAWLEKQIDNELQNRTERITGLVIAKLLTRNYNNVESYIAARVLERCSKEDFRKRVNAGIDAMLKDFGPDLKEATQAAITDAIKKALNDRFKAELKKKAVEAIEQHAEELMDESALLSRAVKTRMISEDPDWRSATDGD